MKIYTGKSAVFGIQLVIDKIWRYVMTEHDTLTVRIVDNAGYTIEKTYTNVDVESDSKMIIVNLTSEETSHLHTGYAKIAAYMNNLCVLPFRYIKVKEAV